MEGFKLVTSGGFETMLITKSTKHELVVNHVTMYINTQARETPSLKTQKLLFVVYDKEFVNYLPSES